MDDDILDFFALHGVLGRRDDTRTVVAYAALQHDSIAKEILRYTLLSFLLSLKLLFICKSDLIEVLIPTRIHIVNNQSWSS